MSPHIATLVFVILIIVLFVFDRDSKAQTSFALWIPMTWLAIGGSRVVSQWLNPTEHSALNYAAAYMEGNPIDRAVQSALMVLGIGVLVSRRQQVWRLIRANKPILVFLLYCGISALWSDYSEVAFRRWLKALGDLVMVLVVLTDPDDSAFLKLPARIGFLLIPASILLMKFYPHLARAFDEVGGSEYTGVATSKNSLGMICLIFGLGSVWRILDAYRGRDCTKRVERMVAHGLIIALTIWLFLWAHSMTSLFCFAFAVGMIVATGMPVVVQKPWRIHLLVGVVLLGSFSVLFLGLGGAVLETVGRNASLTGRTEIWARVLPMAENPFFGTGFESFWLGDRLERMLSIYRGINQAHNGYIEVYLNLGWMGIVLLAFVLIAGYRSILDMLRKNSDAGRLRLAYFVIGVVINFTEASFKMMSPVWIFFLLASMAVPKNFEAKYLHRFSTRPSNNVLSRGAKSGHALSRFRTRSLKASSLRGAWGAV